MRKDKIQKLKEAVKVYPDFPKPGVAFDDVLPILASPSLSELCIEVLAEPFLETKLDYVIGLQSRGFFFAIPLAAKLKIGFVPIRKKGKLPGEVVTRAYELQYGKDVMEIQVGVLKKGDRVLVVDDILATGGTMSSAVDLVTQQGVQIEGVVVISEVKHFKGRSRFQDKVKSIHVLFSQQ